MSELKLVYAGDRDISVWVLQYILQQGVLPNALLLSEPERGMHGNELRELCNHLDDRNVIVGKRFRDTQVVEYLKALEPDYIVCIHFPYIIPDFVLDIPKHGVLNLHPAFLPYNRGWHTPSWALLEGTPIGATLHFMDEDVDTGDIVHQKQLIPSPSDTAHSLYVKLKQLEFEVFKEAWAQIENQTYVRTSQNKDSGTIHKQKELFTAAIQQFQLDDIMSARNFLNKLKALTTSDIREAAYFIENGKRYRIQVNIIED